MRTVDEQLTRVPTNRIFRLAREVEQWPDLLSHYRYVRFRESDGLGGGIVEMSANRPFGIAGAGGPRIDWPTWWLSVMQVDPAKPSIRFRHIEGITNGMDVEWSFAPDAGGTRVRIVHVWDGPGLPFVGVPVAKYLIGPVFIHGIASRTLSGLIRAAEGDPQTPIGGARA